MFLPPLQLLLIALLPSEPVFPGFHCGLSGLHHQTGNAEAPSLLDRASPVFLTLQ